MEADYNTTQGRTYAGAERYYATDEPQDSKPITLEITDRLDNNLAAAVEIRNRLYGLRDRLFGASPTATGNAAGKDASPSCFADAARNGGMQLLGVLSEIDSLSLDLANRL